MMAADMTQAHVVLHGHADGGRNHHERGRRVFNDDDFSESIVCIDFLHFAVVNCEVVWSVSLCQSRFKDGVGMASVNWSHKGLYEGLHCCDSHVGRASCSSRLGMQTSNIT